MKLDQALEIKKSTLTNAQYKFAAEMIWGSVPIDRQWAEETNIFKEKAPNLLKKYPSLDKSDFHIKRCRSFVTGIKRTDGKVVMYLNYRTKKLIVERSEKGKKKAWVDKNNFEITHVFRVKQVIYGYIFGGYHKDMDFTYSLAAGSKFV